MNATPAAPAHRPGWPSRPSPVLNSRARPGLDEEAVAQSLGEEPGRARPGAAGPAERRRADRPVRMSSGASSSARAARTPLAPSAIGSTAGCGRSIGRHRRWPAAMRDSGASPVSAAASARPPASRSTEAQPSGRDSRSRCRARASDADAQLGRRRRRASGDAAPPRDAGGEGRRGIQLEQGRAGLVAEPHPGRAGHDARRSPRRPAGGASSAAVALGQPCRLGRGEVLASRRRARRSAARPALRSMTGHLGRRRAPPRGRRRHRLVVVLGHEAEVAAE